MPAASASLHSNFEPAASEAPRGTLLDIDASQFRAKFDRAPFMISHDLCSHPLFEIDRMLELARTLPRELVEYNMGKVPIGLEPGKTPHNGLSAEETIRQIEECSSWLLFRKAEYDPEYKALIDACMAEIAKHSEVIRPGMTQPEIYLIVSSPNTTTPVHIDPEHNFLLQIRGSKLVTVLDRETVSAEQLERFHCGAHRNLPFDEADMARSVTFDLQPGRGVHIPVEMPHFVRNGPGVSVSFSITFRTPDLYDRRNAFSLNALLRKAGLRPRPIAYRPDGYAMKSVLWRIWVRLAKTLGFNPISAKRDMF